MELSRFSGLWEELVGGAALDYFDPLVAWSKTNGYPSIQTMTRGGSGTSYPALKNKPAPAPKKQKQNKLATWCRQNVSCPIP